MRDTTDSPISVSRNHVASTMHKHALNHSCFAYFEPFGGDKIGAYALKLGAASGHFRPLPAKHHMKWFCLLLFLPLALCLTAIGYGQTAPTPTPLPSVKEGVYFFQNMYSTTVLELKGGNFRYWFRSDVLMRNPPNYPVVGKYQANGGAVTLPHKDIYETNWTSMTYDGKVTLWRPSAVKYWEESKKIDAYGVLFPTDRKPEGIWGGSNGNPSHTN